MNLTTKMDVRRIRSDFPILNTDHALTYLDNAATTHMPLHVQNALSNYTNQSHGSPHRGAHRLSVEATKAYDAAREKVRGFINADSSAQCVFTRNTTESLNLIAYGYLMHSIDLVIKSSLQSRPIIAPFSPFKWLPELRGLNLNIYTAII